MDMTVHLVEASLRLSGTLAASETPNADQVVDAREALNLILQEMNNEYGLALEDIQSFSVVSGTSEYSIGSGQTWDGRKPVNIDNAFIRGLDNVDYPIRLISNIDWAKIPIKSLSDRPNTLYYKKSNSTGTIHLYPTPNESYTIFLNGPLEFTEYSSSATTIDLPNGYLNYLKFALSVEIASEYELQPSAYNVARRDEIKAKLIKSNEKKAPFLQLSTPFGRTRYNYKYNV